MWTDKKLKWSLLFNLWTILRVIQMRQVRISELLPKAFHSVWRATFNSDILHIVCKGWRGSGKSSDIAHIIIQLIMRFPTNAVCIRKVDNTLEQSIFEQLKWAINEQDVAHLFKINKSPLRITYIPRGNYIVSGGRKSQKELSLWKMLNFLLQLLGLRKWQNLKQKTK